MEALRDVRAELRVAHLLIHDRRVAITFEPYGARGGPDFAVTLGGERPVNVEVTRLRRARGEVDATVAVLGKLRQLPPSIANVVVVATHLVDAAAVDVDGAVRAIRARADRKDEAFFASRGFASARAFYERFLRLGAVIVWSEEAAVDRRAASWLNRSARIAVPPRVAAALATLLRSTPAGRLERGR